MTKTLVVAAAACLLTLLAAETAVAQVETHPSVTTDFPSTSRYQIVQSPLAAKWTFKVDTYTGTVFQLVQASSGSLTWQKMPRMPSQDPDTTVSNSPNYQLFLSGMLARVSLIVNLNTGATWILSHDAQEDLEFWAPMQ